MKILWFDTETTGLDPVRNDIITLAGIIEIDKQIVDKIYLKIQPTNWDSISEEALKINGITKEELKSFDSPRAAHQKLTAWLSKYCNKFDSKDKYQPAGYNVTFDTLFLGEFFKKVGDKYYGSWVDYHKLDVATLAMFLHLTGKIKLESYKLVSLAKYFGIEFDAHNAQADIEVTREICYKMMEILK